MNYFWAQHAAAPTSCLFFSIYPLAGLGDLKTSLDILRSFEEHYKKISDWPWEGRTLLELIGALFGAVVIPIVVSLLQSYLEGLFHIIGS